MLTEGAHGRLECRPGNMGVHARGNEVAALPVIIVMVLTGLPLVFAQGSVLAPFTYTIF